MLSARGTAASHRHQELTWDVMASPYCSKLNATGFVNLGIAENSLMQRELLEHISQNFHPEPTALSYGEGPNGSKRLRSALARFINTFFSPATPILPGHISVSSGVTGSLERCAFELGDPGDAFLLGRPYYGAFPAEVGDRAKVRIIPVTFGKGCDPMGLAAVSAYESAILAARSRSQRVRAILLCSPHNPLGRCYPREVLVSLMRLCQRYRLHLLVDEVYALSVFANPRDSSRAAAAACGFTSALAIDTEGVIDPALVHVLWGLSKDFGCNGLRIGCVVSPGNPALVAALDAHAPYRYPAAFLDYAACLVLEDEEWVAAFVAENRRRLAENYAVVASFLEENAVPFHEGTNAGLFVWANLGAVWLRRRRKGVGSGQNGSTSNENGASRSGDDDLNVVDLEQLRAYSDINLEINERLIEEKVYLIDGDECGSESPGYFRIVFAQPMYILATGLERIAKALEL
ncbi:PLP-dependent transferase [Coniochaeta hoffmannii]|uniref:PLP-dependent transferase n=1 Tax=Coniochaeta hoffmannii TaxID=91930 RepID=A0AA38SGI5_9PEZI|nr:PLP-dependent transferase [Coniochaeta hoffmannii]